MPAKELTEATVIRDIAARKHCLLMPFSFDLLTECCSH